MSLEKLKEKLEKKATKQSKPKSRFPIVELLRSRAVEILEHKPLATSYRNRLQFQYANVQPLAHTQKPTRKTEETPKYVV